MQSSSSLQIYSSYQNDGFKQAVASSDWFTALSRILAMSVEIINCMEEGVTPMVHCSDGWDRTSQVCSIVQLMIDPYYRTIQGFGVLIEKDWLQFGHQFLTRNGITNYANEKERSPIFVQFLDCVHQIINQFPTAFEFNLEFLRDLAFHTYSGVYGNFLYDNQSVSHL